MTLKSDLSMEVYVSRGETSNPNKFESDLVFKGGIRSLVLDSLNIDLLNSADGFSVTVFVEAMDYLTTTMLENNLTVSLDGGIQSILFAKKNFITN
jgi:hypothetical protein